MPILSRLVLSRRLHLATKKNPYRISELREVLKNLIVEPENWSKFSTIYIYHIRDKPVACAFVFDHSFFDGYKKRNFTFWIYVQKKYRRMGIGRKLITRAKKDFSRKKFEVAKWNSTAEQFYNAVGQ